jgi:hypothetical protein
MDEGGLLGMDRLRNVRNINELLLPRSLSLLLKLFMDIEKLGVSKLI